MLSKHARYETTDKGRARKAAHNNTPSAKARRKRYRTRQRQETYLAREFVAWDGEGGNEADGSHTYFLLANSDGASLSVREGIPTVAVFGMLLDAAQGVTHIGYGLGYDVNMWLRDLDRDSLTTLYKTGRVAWNGFWLEWRQGKSFSVSYRDRRTLIYDVLPFFQCPFVKACDEYLGTEWECREEIIAGKAARGTFDWSQLDEVAEYNGAELRTLVNLADELRTRLHRCDIRVNRWDGPGAIATSLYKKYSTKSHLASPPAEVNAAARHAYAGGRFEIIRKGHSLERAYQYDIRSAYPSAIRNLPCLAHGTWRRRDNPTRIVPFGMYRIEVEEALTDGGTQPQPLWVRNPDGTVYFTEYPHGWYWSPEAELALEIAERHGKVTVHESWEWIQTCDHVPFSFVEPLYNKRAALKKAGDGAHVGLKLGLNSLYGKLAQQIGWDPGPPLRLPPYHSLEWAGWITSHCRAQVYRAAMSAPDDIIAFETDAVFARRPLDLHVGTRLGEWEETIYDSLTYLKSGMYWGVKVEPDGSLKDVEKTRGINKGSIARADVVAALARVAAGETRVTIPAEQTRFIGIGLALAQDFNKWRRWITSPREIQVSLNGKRIDVYDRADIRKDLGDGWEETIQGLKTTDFSCPYEVAWIEGAKIQNPYGESIEEFRALVESECWE